MHVVTPPSSHSSRLENGDVAPSPWMAEGPFSENANPNFFSSVDKEWGILGEFSPHALCFSPTGSSYFEKATKGCHTFPHGESILLAPLFPQSPFSKNPFSNLQEGVTTPNIVIKLWSLIMPKIWNSFEISYFPCLMGLHSCIIFIGHPPACVELNNS